MAGSASNRIDEKKQRAWVRVLAKWEASGLSIRRFCREHRVRESQFHWWKRLLQRRGAWQAGREREVRETEGCPGSVPFARVELRADPGSPCPTEAREQIPAGRIELLVSDRYRLRLGQGFDPKTLAELLWVLEGHGC